MAIVKQGLFYAKSHEWVEIQGDVARIGITDHAQGELGDLVFAEAAPVGRVVRRGDAIGAVESVKMASDLYTPVSGVIVESRDELGSHPEMINTDPYGTWVVAIKISDPGELNALMDAAAYEAFCLTEG